MRSNKLVLGILAHVDAGKTTLSEGILYTCGTIRTMGRVDHKDAFLDNFALERARGITIFSKQARVDWKDLEITLLDTPGHVDFSAEMERTLQVLDYAVLVISGSDGVQGHSRTLWRLLARYEVPVFIFVNKMDQPDTDREALLAELQEKLDPGCVEFGDKIGTDGFYDALAMCREDLMEEYLAEGTVAHENIADAVASRAVFPCYFGSALKLEGVEELLNGIAEYSLQADYPEEFGARVYKITRDSAGNRLTHLKVTGGSIRSRQLISNAGSAADEADTWEEKVNQLRVINGAQFKTVDEMEAGGILAVTGLTRTFAGQGLGYEENNEQPMLEPVLTYQVIVPFDCDPVVLLGHLRKLEEEDPMLHVVWKELSGEIHVQVMGEVQIEVLKSVIYERFGVEVGFGAGSIVYKETIAEPVIGIGHFEPLRHYAEVHLLLEPGERGSGLQFVSLCSEDLLDKNWQRLILTHLEEKHHVGVLTGSEITDMRISLIAGRAHLKHTEGGDFRQATYRAVRQGLRKSRSVLLEPHFAFTMEMPAECVGRAMSDVQRMQGKFDPPRTYGDKCILTGSAPVSTMRGYQSDFNAYTRGFGRLSCTLKGYEPCHNAAEVVEQMFYDPEADFDNPTCSVFCSHGAGFLVDWDRVDAYAHVDSGWHVESAQTSQNHYTGRYLLDDFAIKSTEVSASMQKVRGSGSDYISQEEIDAIFANTYGRRKEDKKHYRRYHGVTRRPEAAPTVRTAYRGRESVVVRGKNKPEEYLLVDGYNIIFAWEELRELAARNIDSARDKLIDIMGNYQGYVGNTVIIVFDAYKVHGGSGSVLQYHNVHVVYTKEAETADQYIEKAVHTMIPNYQVTVATSDALEQMIIWGSGAQRLSARGLLEDIERVNREIRENYSS